MDLVLRELNLNDKSAFFEGAKEWEGESPHWYSFIWKLGSDLSFEDMLEILRKDALGIDLPPERVKHTMLYAFVDGKIIGRVSIRHELNASLKHRGGHMGYSVAKKYRGKGYATEMVSRALVFFKNLGLSEVMVTCADKNIPSWKIIERFGGKLQDKIWSDEDQEEIRRYWIAV